MNANEILLYFSLLYEGDWQKIYDAIVNKEAIPNNDEASKEKINAINSKYVTILDSDYPNILKNCYKPPFVLFYYGDLSLINDCDKCVAIIGSRKHSSYGKDVTKSITSFLAKHVIIVSGMASGIDAIAHRSAIDNGGKTVAILGSGIDYCYPSQNIELYNQIKKDHLLMSEYPGLVKPKPENFPFRNRIIASLTKGVVVCEANYHSGTSITVSYALSMGKTICCVPNVATSSSLCNRLIKDGATLVENGEDVLNELNISYEK